MHANFIVNTGEATAHDVRELIRYLATKVYEAYGIELTPEVRFLEVRIGRRGETTRVTRAGAPPSACASGVSAPGGAYGAPSSRRRPVAAPLVGVCRTRSSQVTPRQSVTSVRIGDMDRMERAEHARQARKAPRSAVVLGVLARAHVRGVIASAVSRSSVFAIKTSISSGRTI